jgi:hypothetical protein
MVALRSGLQTSPVGDVRRVGEDQDTDRSTPSHAPMDVSVDGEEEATPPSPPEPPIPSTDVQNVQNPNSACHLATSPTEPVCDNEWIYVPPSRGSGASRRTPSPSPHPSPVASANRYEAICDDATLEVDHEVTYVHGGQGVAPPAPHRTPATSGPAPPSASDRSDDMGSGGADAPTVPAAGGSLRPPSQPSSACAAVGMCTIPGCRLPRGQHQNGFSVQGYRRHMSTVHGPRAQAATRSGPVVRRISMLTTSEDPSVWLDGHALDPTSWTWLGQSVGLCRSEVPSRSQRLWAEAVGIFAHQCSMPLGQAGAWWALLALPRLCLPIKNAEGSALRPKAYDSNFLLSLAIQGRFGELYDLACWREAQAWSTPGSRVRATALVRVSADAPTPADTMSIPERNIRRANLMMRRGRPSKALTSLTGGGSLSISDDIIARLRDLHPTSGAISPDERANLQESVNNFQNLDSLLFSNDFAAKVLGSCPKMSAPGASGWTFEMFSPIKKTDEAWDRFIGALMRIACGRIPPEVAKFLRTSRLVPIRKVSVDPEAVRPVAVGEVFPRFVGRVLCRKLSPKFAAHFAPIQFGVATPAGTEMCIKTILSHFSFLESQGSTDTIILGMDAINAFNTAARGKALLEVAKNEDFQCLMPILWSLYGNGAPLHIFEERRIKVTLESTSGVRQGDPFGSFLFAQLIQEDLLQVHNTFLAQGALVVAYLDDIFIVGPRAAALDAANELSTRLETKNLKFGKNQLFVPNALATPSPRDQEGPGLIFEAQDSSKFLGAFLGRNANEKLENLVTEKIGDKCKALIEFARQGYAFTALQLLLACVGNIPNYFLRMMPPGVTAPMAVAADRTLIDAFLSISGLNHTHDADSFAGDGIPGCVLRMPQKQGGFGLHSQVTLGKSAYIASWLTVGPAIATRFPHLKATVANFIEGRTPDGTCSDLVHEIVEGLSQQRAHVSDTLHLSQVLDDRAIDKDDTNPPPRVEGRVEHLQQAFAAEEGRRVAHTLHNKVEALDSGTHLLTKAWHKGLCGFARASYLHAPPSRGVKPLTNVEFEFAIRRHFRIPLRDPHLRPRCSCGDPLDPYGDHVDTCRHLVEMRTWRHDTVNVKGLIEPAKQVKLKPRREPAGLVEGTRGRPADTLIESSLGLRGAENTWLCFDVVGCAPFSDAHARVAARHPGGAMVQALGRKIRQAIQLRASCHDLTVIPMAFESQGVLHEHWAETYHLFARHWAQHNNRSKREASALVRMWAARTSLTIQRVQYSLFQRMLQNLTVSRHDEIPHSIRQPDEGVVALASACLPELERGSASLHLTQS